MKQRSMRPLAQIIAAGATLALAPTGALAQVSSEYLCERDAQVPCAFNIEAVELQKTPPVFKFQARVSATKLPRGSATFSELRVRLLRGQEVMCTETIRNVRVREGVLNLDVGRGMNCEIDELIAESQGLTWDLCLGATDDTCLGRLELPSVGYAVKSNFAPVAKNAVNATLAAGANWAHRGIADEEIFLRNNFMTGYYDFYTHIQSRTTWLYATPEEFAPYEGGGFIQWTPVRNRDAKNMRIGGRNAGTGVNSNLRHTVFAADKSTARGGMTVAPTQAGAVGLNLPSGGIHVVGNSDVTGRTDIQTSHTVDSGGVLVSAGGLAVESSTSVHGNARFDATATINDVSVVRSGDVTVEAGGVHVTGDTGIDGHLRVNGTLTANSLGPIAAGDFTVQAGGATVNQAATVDRDLTVDQTLTIGSMDPLLTGGPLGRFLVEGNATMSNNVNVEGALEVGGRFSSLTDASIGRNITVKNGARTRGDARSDGALSIAGSFQMRAGGAVDVAVNTLAREPAFGGSRLAMRGPAAAFAFRRPLRAEAGFQATGLTTFNVGGAGTAEIDGFFRNDRFNTGVASEVRGSTEIIGPFTLTPSGLAALTTVPPTDFFSDLSLDGTVNFQQNVTIDRTFTINNDASCPVGMEAGEGINEGRCVDVDECATNPGICGSRACTNRLGTFECCYTRTDGSQDCLLPGQNRIFVTSQRFDGNLGGLAGADALCTAAAANANMGGQWYALIGDGNTIARDRVPDDAGPFHSITGVKVADTKADLLDDSVDAPPQRTEFGGLIELAAGRFAWSGSTGRGLVPGGGHSQCNNWTTADGGQQGVKGLIGSNQLGTSSHAGWVWLDNSGTTCNTENHLYCIER